MADYLDPMSHIREVGFSILTLREHNCPKLQDLLDTIEALAAHNDQLLFSVKKW